MAASAGLILDPWQEFILDVLLGERADGKWAAREVGYLVARQNGKGGVLDALALAALFLIDDEVEILHSAHEFKTAKKAYRNLKSLVQGAPHLLAQVERRGSRVVGFRHSNEDTSITLQNGTVIRYMARSNNTGRGFSSQRLIVDEAQECSEETRSALQYIVSAQRNPQIVYCGTVPSPRNNGEVWESLRDRGRAGGDSTLAWMEWTPPEDADPMSDETSLWSNPGRPYRISAETIEAERNAATTPEAIDGYKRERVSIWPSGSKQSEFDMAAWSALVKPREGERPSPVALSVAVSQDRKWAHIGLAGVRSDGLRHLQVAKSFQGTGSVVDKLVEMVEKWSQTGVALDPSSPAGSLIADLSEAGIEPVLVTGRELGQATGMLLDGFEEKTIAHSGQQVLDISLESARLRDSGGSKVWDHKVDTDIAPVQAVTLALFVLTAKKPEKPRSGSVW